VTGGSADDEITFNGDVDAASFEVRGMGGEDTIDASAVTTAGGSFWGGADNDTITGTAAADTFYWNVGEGSDTIAGGDPVTSPGDSLTFGGGFVQLAFDNAGPSYDGTLSASDTSETITFTSIEGLALDATGSSTGLGYDGDMTLQNNPAPGSSQLLLGNGFVLPINSPTGASILELQGGLGDDTFTIAGYDSSWTGGLSYEGLGGHDVVTAQVSLGEHLTPWQSVSFTAETVNLHDVYTTGSQTYTAGTITLASILSSTGSFIQVGGDLILQSSSKVLGTNLTFGDIYTDGNGAWDVQLGSTGSLSVGQVGTAGNPLGYVKFTSSQGDLLPGTIHASEAELGAFGGAVGTSASPVQTFISRLSGYGEDGFHLANSGGPLRIVAPGIFSFDGDIWLQNSGSILVLEDRIETPYGTTTVSALGSSSDIVTGGDHSPAILGWNVFLDAGRDVVAGYNGYGDIVAGESLFLTAGRDFVVDDYTWIEVAQANFPFFVSSPGPGQFPEPVSCAYPPAPGSVFIAGQDIVLDDQLDSDSHILSNGGDLLFQAGRDFIADWGDSGGYIRSLGGNITVEAGNGARLYGPMYSCGGDIAVETFAAPISVGEVLDTTVTYDDGDGDFPLEGDEQLVLSPLSISPMQSPFPQPEPRAVAQGVLTVEGQVFGYEGNTLLGPGNITLIAPPEDATTPTPTFDVTLWDITNRTPEWQWASNYVDLLDGAEEPVPTQDGAAGQPLSTVYRRLNAWFAANTPTQSAVYFYSWR
jgi:hypothetical protein